MLVSYNWLKEFFFEEDLEKLSPKKVIDLLNNQGIEVASFKDLSNIYKNVVVAEVLSREKHPNADKLSLCKVFDGKETFQVVCGAKNVRENIKIAFSKIGAVLPGKFEIKKAKIRGIESNGMICSKSELNLEKESAGIWILPDSAKVGEELSKFLDFDDTIFEIEITPNRGDCLSILGIAREISAGLGIKIKMPKILDVNEINSDNLSVEIKDKEALSYSALMLENVNNTTETPIFMQSRLIKCGLKSINFLVDITNYILLELGQPMHVFDYDKLVSTENNKNKKILVRKANSNEKILLLNGDESTLSPDDLVIADEKNPIAIAGIMGGENSSSTFETKNIIFESAVFSPKAVRKTSKRLNISSDSSYRFERGVSNTIKNLAIKRALYLLDNETKNYQIKAYINKESETLQAEKIVSISLEKINKILGKTFNPTEIKNILEKLNFTYKIDNEIFTITVPDYRNDINSSIDIVEEIARLSGYDNIAPLPLMIYPNKNDDKIFEKINDIKRFFINLGFFEAINYPFTSLKNIKFLNKNENENNLFKIINPLSENDQYLANTKLFKLIENAIFSFRHNETNIRLFEINKIYKKITSKKEDLADNETFDLNLILTGLKNPFYWNEKNREKVDFFYIKGICETFLKKYNFNFLEVEKSDYKNLCDNFLEKSSSLAILVDNAKIGFLGKLSESSKKFFDITDIKNDIFVLQISISKLLNFNFKNDSNYHFSNFPIVERDLSLIMKNSVSYGEIENIIKNETKGLLLDINLIDIYEGEKIEKGYKNLCIRFRLQSNKETLTDSKVNFFQSKILNSLEKNLSVKLRVE